jgi:hypothetical protein
MPRPNPNPNPTTCKTCGHAAHLHQGSGKIGNTKGCGAVGCGCRGFKS